MSINITHIEIHSEYEGKVFTYLIYIKLPIGVIPVILTLKEYDALDLNKKSTISENIKMIGNVYNLTLSDESLLLSVNKLGNNKRIVFEGILKKDDKVFYTEYFYKNLYLKAVLNFPDKTDLINKLHVDITYKFDLSNYTFTLGF